MSTNEIVTQDEVIKYLDRIHSFAIHYGMSTDAIKYIYEGYCINSLPADFVFMVAGYSDDDRKLCDHIFRMYFDRDIDKFKRYHRLVIAANKLGIRTDHYPIEWLDYVRNIIKIDNKYLTINDSKKMRELDDKVELVYRIILRLYNAKTGGGLPSKCDKVYNDLITDLPSFLKPSSFDEERISWFRDMDSLVQSILADCKRNNKYRDYLKYTVDISNYIADIVQDMSYSMDQLRFITNIVESFKLLILPIEVFREFKGGMSIDDMKNIIDENFSTIKQGVGFYNWLGNDNMIKIVIN